jgi:hypothetical protein
MDIALCAFDRTCQILIRLLLRLALILDNIRRRFPRRARKLRGSLRRMRQRWLERQGVAPSHPRPRHGRRAANRTPEYLEDKLVRLHVEQPQLGAGQLRYLAERVLASTPIGRTAVGAGAPRKRSTLGVRSASRRAPSELRTSTAA